VKEDEDAHRLKLAFWYIAVMATYYNSFSTLVENIPLKPIQVQRLRHALGECLDNASRNKTLRRKFCKCEIGNLILKWIQTDPLTCIAQVDKAVPNESLAYESSRDITLITNSKNAIRKLFEG
jgi:hypothetical protein